MIVDSFIGPFTRHRRRTARSRNSEVEHSVIMDRSTIIDIPRLEDSLIGRKPSSPASQMRPRALRLMVGDHCQIDVE